MEKYRITFTVQDYFDYIGTNPYYSTKEKMLKSIPDEFRENGYNIKFKQIYDKEKCWIKCYRIHMSVRMSEEKIKQILTDSKLDNVSYKLITKHF